MKKSVSRANQAAPNDPLAVAEFVPDFDISHHGTVSLFHPLSNRAEDWLRLHCPHDDEHQYLGKALAIEHRFVSDIVQLAFDDGLVSAKSADAEARKGDCYGQ